MTTIVESSRQYLLNHLPENGLQRQIILRDLFHHYDRVPIAFFNHFEKYQKEKGKRVDEKAYETGRQRMVRVLMALKTPSKMPLSTQDSLEGELNDYAQIHEGPVKVRHLQWGLSIEAMLQSLETDLQLLRQVTDWDLTVLVDALRLITFLYNVFDQDLRDLYSSFKPEEGQFIGSQRLKELIQNHLDSIREQKEALEKETLEKEHEYKQLAGETTMKAIMKECMVASATLQELLVRNTVSQCQGEILPMLQNKTNVELQAIGKEIASKILGPALLASCKPEKPRGKLDAAWIPRTIAIVIDTASGFIFTGSTQAMCENFVLFRDAAAKINRHRLGKTQFVTFLDIRSKRYSDLVTPMTKVVKGSDSLFCSSLYCQLILQKSFDHQTVEELRNLDETSRQSVVPGQQIYDTGFPELPKGLTNSHILCWAISGENLEFVPPCLRCQSLYDTWVMWGMPDSDDDRAHCFSKGMGEPSSKVAYKEGESFCCAESIAAAKVHASRHGVLSLS